MLCFFENRMFTAENNQELRQFSSELGRPTMTLLSAVLFIDSGAPRASAPAARREFGSVRSFFVTCIQPALHLSFRKRAMTDETL